MNQKATGLLTAVLGALIVGGCGMSDTGADVSGSSGGGNYSQTKQMVVDILNSKDGQEALLQTMTNPEFKSQVIASPNDVKKAMTQFIESSQGKTFLSEAAKDPTFAAALAKASQPELKTTIQELMKEPSFQQDMLVLLQSDEFTKNLQTMMQGPQFRSDLQKLILQTMQSPTYQVHFQAMLQQAIQKAMSAGQASGGNSSGGGSSGGSQGGSGSGGGDSSS